MSKNTNVLEDEIHNRNREELEGLSTAISDLSMISMGIRDHLKSEKPLYTDVDAAFDKNRDLLGKSLPKLKNLKFKL